MAVKNFHAPSAEENDQPKVYGPDISNSAQISVEDNEMVRKESEKKLKTSEVTARNDGRVGPDEVVTENIVSPQINRSWRHANAK